MANQYYGGPGSGRGGGGGGGGQGGPGRGGYGMRGGGHPMGGMMGHQGQRGGGGGGGGMMGHQGQGGGPGMMMGDRGDPNSMRGWDFDMDSGASRGYDRSGYDMNMGPMGGQQQHGNNMGRGQGQPPRHGGMPPSGRGVSSSRGQPQNMMDESGSGPKISPEAKPITAAPGGVRFANDCEIIVTAKAQQQYAEMIEREIKDCSLKVDLMFPKPDVKLSAFIDNIAAMGTIFAVVIRPDNENHRSVSVHVLRGPPKPEEHRNMPLTAAYQLIKERYYELKRKEVGVIPDTIKRILKFLLDDRQLTELEYGSVIRFLQDRLRKQNAFEKRTSNVVGDDNINDIVDTPEAVELQARIMSQILGDINETAPAAERETVGDLHVPRPTQPLGALQADPKVQKAFDTLMNPAFLSNLNSATNQGPSGGMGRGGGGFGRGQGFVSGGGF